MVETAVAARLAEIETHVVQLPQVMRQIVEASLAEALTDRTLTATTLETDNPVAADLLAVFDGQLLID
jgi:hypothetical protein